MSDLVKCMRCSFHGKQTDFPRKSNLQYLKTCAPCTQKRNDKAAEKQKPGGDKENAPPPKRRALGRDKTAEGPPTIKLDMFISLLEANKDGGFEVQH